MRNEVPLSDYTTIRIGGAAPYLFEPLDAGDAAAGLRAIREAGLDARILGGGSNLLVAGLSNDAVVVHPSRLDGVEWCGTTVVAGAGVALSKLIGVTTGEGLGGLEVLAGIPGQLGGAVAMNAGGRYGEIGNSVEWVEIATPGGTLERLGPRDLAFAYRSTQLPVGAMVTSVALRLTAGDRRALKARAGAIMKEKNAAQPTTGWNFGCMFKNPAGASAGKLVASCGLRGVTRGAARISPLHGNFVENVGDAAADDVIELIEVCERAVRDAHGVTLEREVRVWNS